MSTSYNPLIPNPPDPPSSDVFVMQTNSAAIQNLLVIDHVGFNVAQAGQHKQVTFQGNNVPASLPNGAKAILYTDNDSNGDAQLFFYNGTIFSQLTSEVTPTPGLNGYTYLPGGIILQWGRATAVGGVAVITFPLNPFPNNLYSITLSPNGANAAGISWDTQSTSGFTAHTANSGTFFTWMATGN